MISIYYGTRPEYIKVYPLYKQIKEMELSVELVKVIQHTDLISTFYCDRSVKLFNNEGYSNRLSSVISSILSDDSIGVATKLVVVQGDTATAFAVALNAFNRKIPIAHIEAGLRTYDVENPFPEEAYRRFISVMASYHFCVSDSGLKNLEREKIEGKKYVVGNTVLDSLLKYRDEITYGNKVLVTLHRRENKQQMREWFELIEQIAKERKHLEFVLPLHPSTDTEVYKSLFSAVKVVDPLPHNLTIQLLKECRFVITDSGGIQEESSFFKKKSIVCRKKTEREDGLGMFSVLCSNPQQLKEMVFGLENDPIVDAECPYGDGRSSERIAIILKGLI